MRKAFRNPEIAKNVELNIIVTIVCALILYVFSTMMLRQVNGELISSNGAAIETLIKSHPEMKNEIITDFTQKYDKGTIESGIGMLKQYGIEKNTYDLNDSLSRFHDSFITLTLMIFILFVIFHMIISLRQFNSIFTKINEVYNGAEKIIKGEYSLRLSEYRDGELGKLSTSFNKMSSIIENTFDTLKKEKGFLKNTMQDISHQLKTPLSSLKIFNELLLNQSVKDEKTLNEFLHESQKQLDKMEWLIINLLKMAKLDAGAIEFRNRDSSIEETIDESVKLLRPMYTVKNQKMIVESSDKAYFAHDRKWLIEAFSNIIKNCIEHTDDEGKIKITIYNSPIMVKVTIGDNGAGISKEDLPHIFERFYKGKGVYNKNSTGIGLSLAKSIIENQGGFITVKSVIGVGTTFNIVFLYDKEK
ncbi:MULTISPECIES: sensor histidine kinase [Clostridium]|uniref:sensor histidine kinase n=1 Tax=Clostridium TaxID=1485 RepID=UPI0008252E7F|nr:MULTISPECIES: HAMP domain-containing sensor histidine kinase [Clostridium]PJI07900.1 sensor histidine kinase [Clostridium sp. CT7]